jgi:tRNA dimethylallyltransferase
MKGPPRRTAIALAGPTASGKSEAALALAETLDGEIVSVDSMQVYRGLDVGTAKPSREEQARVPHHLVDVVDLTEAFDAARFVQQAERVLAEIYARNRVPILCGGTGLYFKALLEGLGSAPAADPALRAQLDAIPLADLLQELAAKDPATFARIDRQNQRRVRRAVEVLRLTGQPVHESQASWKRPQTLPLPTSPSAGETGVIETPLGGVPAVLHLFGLARDREDLRRRIDQRVDKMFAQGLVEETQRLLSRGLAENPVALQALGYRQVVEYLQGARSLEQTQELVKARTRLFAKKQMTWFRRQLSLHWVAIGPEQPAPLVAEEVLRVYRQASIPHAQ